MILCYTLFMQRGWRYIYIYIYIYIYNSFQPTLVYIYTCIYTRVVWKVHMMTSYLPLMTFLLMRFKHCNTYGRSVWAARRTMLKNKPHLFTFPVLIGLTYSMEIQRINFVNTQMVGQCPVFTQMVSQYPVNMQFSAFTVIRQVLLTGKT